MNIYKAALSMCIIIGLSACAGYPYDDGYGPQPAYERITFEGTLATPQERARCESVGGLVRRAGLLGAENCIQNLPDAGAICGDALECLGRCVFETPPGIRPPAPGTPVTGVCEATDEVFGCKAFVNQGRLAPTLCID